MQRIRSAIAALAFWAFGAVGALAEGHLLKAAPCPPDALGTSRTIEIGTKGGLALGLKSYPQTLDLADHEVVLTFDDGPWPGTTPAVLEALARQCVKATFFLVGRHAEAAPWLVRREVAEGHTVGHHTYSHPAATLRGLSETQAETDIERGFAADDKAAYGMAGPEPKVPFFRFPGFADTPELRAWLSQRNIAVFGTDLWANDWLMMTPWAELDYVLSELEARKRGILLLHDTRRQTARMLPELLYELKRRGFKIVHLVPGSAQPALYRAPQGWTSTTEAIIHHVKPGLVAEPEPTPQPEPAKAVAPAEPDGTEPEPATEVAPAPAETTQDKGQ
jgi:peptidoglycan-N-acetylglucosamine deacetylase